MAKINKSWVHLCQLSNGFGLTKATIRKMAKIREEIEVAASANSICKSNVLTVENYSHNPGYFAQVTST